VTPASHRAVTRNLMLSGLSPAHRMTLSVAIARAGMVTQAPMFRDSWVSLDDIADMTSHQWDLVDEALGRISERFTGTLIGREWQAIRDDWAAITSDIEAADRELRRALDDADAEARRDGVAS
jgi:hypothetical protein